MSLSEDNKIHKSILSGEALKEIRIAFIGNITLQPIQSPLKTLCLEIG